MQPNSFLFYIYCTAIFSIFLPVTVYPIFFLIFSFFNIIIMISIKRKVISRKLLSLTILLCVFFFMSSISFFLNLEVSDSVQYLKILINFIFLINVAYYINYNTYVFLNKRIILQYLFELIIFLSFIQIIINVHIMNLWMMPFVGVKDSVMAYKIVEPMILFGTTEKNIWATKIAFIQIIYFSFGYFRYFKVENIKVYLFWAISLFNLIYTFSRTAQLVFILFIIMLVIWKIFYIYKNRVLKIFSIFLFILISVPMGILIYDKLFHITLGAGDGLASRLVLWQALYNHLDHMNIYIGNGILYAEYLISTTTVMANNNFHNVFLNTFSDQGVIGLLLYILLLRMIFFTYKLDKKLRRFIVLVLFFPFFVCINSQYLGYDNDIVIFFSLVLILIKFLKFTSNEYQKHLNHNINI